MKGTVRKARVGTVEYLRFEGVIRYTQCAGLEGYIAELFETPDFSHIAIDLEPADMLDSTALGLLARISIECKKLSDKKPVIFLKNGELAHILKRVCFDQVFDIITKPREKDDMQFVELASVSKSEEEVLSYVIDAHKSLAELSSDNEHYFTDITNALK